MNHATQIFNPDDIDHWIFDLDNVLYPAKCDLFALIDVRMGDYVARLLDCDLTEARAVQKQYFFDHGTTLSGLMIHHDVDPRDFLDYVHDIDMSRLEPAPRLREAIEKLPGEKLVFTNGDKDYAKRVLQSRGLDGLFDQLHDIHASNLVPKPEEAAYHAMIAKTGIDPARAVFVEDMAKNLNPAKTLGMATIWVNTGAAWGAAGHSADHIDLEIGDLERWLLHGKT